MKLKWDISCPTYIEFLPFIYDILDSSLQEDIGKGNQVRSCQFLVHFWTRPNVKLFLRQTKRCPIICDQKNFDNMSTNTLTNSQHSAIGKVRFTSLWRHDPVCYVIITFYSEPDLITKPPSVIAVQCVSVFFMQQDYLKTRTITSALTPYIPVSRTFYDSYFMIHIFSDLYRL